MEALILSFVQLKTIAFVMLGVCSKWEIGSGKKLMGKIWGIIKKAKGMQPNTLMLQSNI